MGAPFQQFYVGDKGLARLAPHTITTKPWPIETAIEKYAAAGIGGMSIWRDAVEGREIAAVKRQLSDAGITPVSYVRGGFYTDSSAAKRRAAIDDNQAMIDEAAELGIPMIVLVCGATPGQTMTQNVAQIVDGIQATVAHAESVGVHLAIEPLHPMYADQRSAVATMRTANDICDLVASPNVGVAVDVFHVWWDSELEAQIVRCGQAGRIFAFHMCDWKLDMEHMLFDRGLMGEGIIDVARMRRLVEDAGFHGFLEVEIFSNRWWAEDQDVFLQEIVRAYGDHC
jgi:sugar phosphate isomerase/epimerase